MSFLRDLFFGTPEKHEQVSTLGPEGQQLLQQLMAALQGQGAGGAFGESADYYRQILGDDPELMQQFMAPEMRKFQQETIPGLAEQFAGMGSGALSGSGFRTAGLQAGTDLQERLASLRAGLKQQAAQGLTGMGGMAMQPGFTQDVVTQQGSGGLFEQVAPLAAQVASAYFGGPAMAAGSKPGSPMQTGVGMGKKSPYVGGR